MIQHTCDRCQASWLTQIDASKEEQNPPSLKIELTKDGETETIKYEALCPRCEAAVGTYLKNVAASGRGAALRGRKRKQTPEDAASATEPATTEE